VLGPNCGVAWVCGFACILIVGERRRSAQAVGDSRNDVWIDQGQRSIVVGVVWAHSLADPWSRCPVTLDDADATELYHAAYRPERTA
jgi:hypothetical protein